MLLPHELVHKFCKHTCSRQNLFDRGGMDTVPEGHLRIASEQLALDGDVLGIGLWMDGVACKWDRSESMDMVTMSLPGLTRKWSPLRVPLFAIPHCWVLKEHTFDDVTRVLEWSFRHLVLNRNATCRHDNTPWTTSDAKRSRFRGPVGCCGLLCQITGDWKMYKELFRFPQFNEKNGCCFKCSVVPDGIRDTDSTAPWRTQRLDHWPLIARIRVQGKSPSPLFGCPGFHTKLCRLDWLHVADLGVAADWLGQLFLFLQRKFPGRSMKASIANLWIRIQALYKEYGSESKLDDLTEHMLSLDKRLRCCVATGRKPAL